MRSQGIYKVRIEFVGYKAQTIRIDLKSGETVPVTYLIGNALSISQINVPATVDYGKITVSPIDMILRPTSKAQDLLKLVPGLFIAQHAEAEKQSRFF